MLLLFLIRVAESHLFVKELLFIRATVRVFLKRLSNHVCVLLPLLVLMVRCGM